jgi:hypothetical protein
VPAEVTLSVEVEQDGDEMGLEIGVGWRGGPLAG